MRDEVNSISKNTKFLVRKVMVYSVPFCIDIRNLSDSGECIIILDK